MDEASIKTMSFAKNICPGDWRYWGFYRIFARKKEKGDYANGRKEKHKTQHYIHPPCTETESFRQAFILDTHHGLGPF